MADVSHRAALSELHIADIIHVTPAKHAGDLIANIPFVRTRHAAKSVDLQPLKIGGGASPHSVTSANYRDRTVLSSCVRRGMVSRSPRSSPPLRRAQWRLGREGYAEGVLEPSCFVPHGKEDFVV
jgi:hypothetical protein